MYVWLALLGTALILLPLPDPDFGPFAGAAESEQFLRTIWQVEAAALALSLTIIVFAVQAYRTSTQERYGGTLRRYIRASFLQEGYELGIISLLLVGAVLLGAGNGGPSGSAGLVAAGTSLLSIAVLPMLLSRALLTTHRDFLHEERTGRLKQAVQDEVDREVEARFGLLALQRLGEVYSFELSLFGARGRQTETDVAAGRAGAVADLNLRRLIRLVRRSPGPGTVVLRARLAEYVGGESTVIALPLEASRSQRRLAAKVVRIDAGRRKDATLSRYLDDLREEAVAAIKAGGPAAFDLVAEAYVETLKAFPLAWQRYGQEYDDAIAAGIEYFPIGPVDEISKQFYANVVDALRVGARESLLTAAYLPIRVASWALGQHADGLLKKLLNLSPAFLAAAWTYGGDSGSLLEERARRHLVEFVRFSLEPGLEEGELTDRRRLTSHVRLVYAQFQTMLKMGVERGKIDFVRKLDGDWGTLLRHLDMEVLDPNPRLIPSLEEAAASGQIAAERLARARENAELQALRAELDGLRDLAHFGLALWAWRQQPPAWRESYDHFSSQLGGLPEVAATTAKAIDADNEDRVPWSDWILDELQEGEAHAIGSTEAIVETFTTIALRVVNPEEAAPVLPAADWMPQHLERAREVLASAVSDPRNSDLPDVAARAGKVKEAFEAAAAQWDQQERQSVMEAPLDEEKVSEFRAATITVLKSARAVPDLLRLGGAVRTLDDEPPDALRFEFWPHKELFIADGRMLGADMIAREIGQKVAHAEVRHLIEPMARVERRAITEGGSGAEEFAARLRDLLQSLQARVDTGFLALFLPINWRLSEALGLPFLGAQSVPPDQLALSEGSANNFVGAFADAPAFQFPEVPSDVLYVVDLAHWMSGRQGGPSDEEMISIRSLTPGEAQERAARTEGREEAGEDEIAARWRERAVVTVKAGLELSQDQDTSAVTAVELPNPLRQ